MAARVTQVVIEPAIESDETTARVNQAVLETVFESDETQARVTQVFIEIAIAPENPIPPNPVRVLKEICMPNLNADEIILHRHKRNWLQKGGALPVNPVQFAGKQGQYMKIEGVSIPRSSVDPIYMHDPDLPGRFRLVNRSITAPDLPEASLVFTERHGAIPAAIAGYSCPFNVYEVSGVCRRLDDFLRGWSDYVLVYSGAIVTDADLGDRSAWGDSDDQIEDSLSVTLADVYPVGKLGFGEVAGPEISREVIDVVYGSQVQCGNCGPRDDGSKLIYAVVTTSGAGSPGLPAEVVYTLDGGANWNQTNIDGFGATEAPLAIDVVGQYLLVLGADAYYYASLSSVTGAPGVWTKVSTGFVGAGSPNDIYVSAANEVWFVGDAGYIYRSSDITAGVTVASAGAVTSQNLYRVHGEGDTIVAGGAGSTVIKSINRGVTFAVTTDSPADIAIDVGAIAVLDELVYWVGTRNSGRLYFTLNGGETWNEKAFSGAGAGNVYDIVFATREVGYFSHSTNTPTARLFSTWDGGFSFTTESPRILNWPTFNRANRLAYPKVAYPDTGIAANNIAVAGLSGGGTDGILLLGVGNFV